MNSHSSGSGTVTARPPLPEQQGGSILVLVRAGFIGAVGFARAYVKSMRLYYSFITGIAGWLGVAYYDYVAHSSAFWMPWGLRRSRSATGRWMRRSTFFEVPSRWMLCSISIRALA